MTRSWFAAAALTLIAGSAPAASIPPASVAELRACGAQKEDHARLACFDAALARLETVKTDFGGENLRAAEKAEPVFQQAQIVKVSFNAIKHFTITLDNGQVWRQLDSDTAVARFRGHEPVKISQGFLDSYSLSVEGVWGSYKVKRIK